MIQIRNGGQVRLAVTLSVLLALLFAASNWAAPRTASQSAAAPSSQLTGQVTYWHHFTSDIEMQGMAGEVQAFESSNPGVTVVPETIPNPDYMAKIVTAVQANQRPDTAMVAVERLADMVGMGALLPLTARIKAWSGYADVPQKTWDDVTINGEIYGIPAFSFVGVLYYRADWFKEAGLTPPTTWAEFEQDAIALTDESKGRFGFGLRGGAGGGGNLLDVMESFGVKLVDSNGQPTADRATVLEALKFYTGLATVHHTVPSSAAQDGYTQMINGFKTGQTAMILHHLGSLVDIQTAPGLKPGVELALVPMPSGPGGSASRVSALYNGIMSDTNADASWAWITHWADVQAQLDFMQITGYFPPSTAAQKDPRIANDPLLAAGAQAAAVGLSETQFKGLPAFLDEVLLLALQEVLTGQKTVDAATDDIMQGLARVTQ